MPVWVFTGMDGRDRDFGHCGLPTSVYGVDRKRSTDSVSLILLRIASRAFARELMTVRINHVHVTLRIRSILTECGYLYGCRTIGWLSRAADNGSEEA